MRLPRNLIGAVGTLIPTVGLLTLFFVLPVSVLFMYSLGHSTFFSLTFGHTIANYARVAHDPVLRGLVWRSMWVGSITAGACVVLSFPLVFAITLGPFRRYATTVLFLVLMSLLAAYIVRIYAMRTILGREGLVNRVLEDLGLISAPLKFILYSQFAVVLTLINVTIPLAIVPEYAALSGIDPEIVRASRSLGATPWQALRHITIPLASRGLIGAFALCCIASAGDFITPELVGGPSSQLAGNAIADKFGFEFDWATGGALAFTLLIAIGACVAFVAFAMRLFNITDKP